MIEGSPVVDSPCISIFVVCWKKKISRICAVVWCQIKPVAVESELMECRYNMCVCVCILSLLSLKRRKNWCWISLIGFDWDWKGNGKQSEIEKHLSELEVSWDLLGIRPSFDGGSTICMLLSIRDERSERLLLIEEELEYLDYQEPRIHESWDVVERCRFDWMPCHRWDTEILLLYNDSYNVVYNSSGRSWVLYLRIEHHMHRRCVGEIETGFRVQEPRGTLQHFPVFVLATIVERFVDHCSIVCFDLLPSLIL